MSFTLRARRVLIGAVTGAMALSLLPAGAASAGIEEVCAGAEDAGFTDAGTTHADNIDCLAAYEITTGQTATTFGTFSPLSRGQAATLFVNFALVATDGAIADDIDESVDVPFTDIEGTTHESNIEILYRLGLIEGTTETTYSPSANISRAQFATILFNAHVALGVEFDADYAQAFADTIGSVHNDSINALAGEGIISGTTATTYEPSANVLRGQTATLLMESAGVLDDAGLWEASLPGQTNQTFTVTPSDELSVTDDDENDERQYTVENPAAGEEHEIVLFAAGNVSVDGDGIVSFTEAGGVADAGTVTSEITVVNGTSTGGVQATSANPAGGQITFTVAGEGFEDVIPVVFFDADGDGNLDLDADDLPVEDEVFGIGGQLTVLPVEADSASITLDSEIYAVDKEANWVVIDLDATGNATPVNPRLVEWDDDDTFFVDGTTAADQVTMADFEAVLTVGDNLDAATDYSQNFSSQLVLDNLEPQAPTLTDAADATNSVTATNTTAEFDVDETTIIDGATVNVYIAADGDAFADADLAASSDADEDADAADFQITVDGLTADTAYEVYLTQEIDGEESGSNETAAGLPTGFSTTVAPGDLAIASVSPNDVIDGTGDTAEVVVEFNEAATLDAAVGGSTNYDVITVYPTNQPGVQFDLDGDDVTLVSAAISGDTTDTWTITLDDLLNDSNGSVEYTIEIDAGVAADGDGAPNAALTATFNY